MPALDPARLRHALEALAPLPEEAWRLLEKGLVARAYPRGARVLTPGERVDWLGFLDAGLVRIFAHASEREVNLGFDCEGRFVGAYDAFVQRTPSAIGLDALEPTRLWRIERRLLAQLEVQPAWRELFRRLIEHQLVRKLDKELRLRTRTPEQRYAELVRSGSWLVRRVPQYHLATYLGITPETLSRIRARLAPARS